MAGRCSSLFGRDYLLFWLPLGQRATGLLLALGSGDGRARLGRQVGTSNDPRVGILPPAERRVLLRLLLRLVEDRPVSRSNEDVSRAMRIARLTGAHADSVRFLCAC